MKYRFLILIFVAACFPTSSLKLSDQDIRSIRYLIASRDSVIADEFDSALTASTPGRFRRPAISRDSGVQFTSYEGILASPFEKSSFHLFNAFRIEPSSYHVFCLSDSLLSEVPRDSLTRSFASKVFVDFINLVLSREATFSDRQLLELTRFIVRLTDPGYGFNRLLNNPGDILLKENEILPDSILRSIKQPQIAHSDNSVTVTFFVWDKGTTELRKIQMKHVQNMISFSGSILGLYGERSFIL